MEAIHDDNHPETLNRDQAVRPQRGRWRFAAWLMFMAVLGGLIVCLVRHGWDFRNQAWVYFEAPRYQYDIWRNFHFGAQALRDGLLNQYDDQAANPPSERLRLNYSPLRTVVFAFWAKSTGEPERTPLDREVQWEPSLEFNRFLNDFNVGIALAGAVGAGLLVQHWVRRQNRLAHLAEGRAPPRNWWAWLAAVIAFGLYWYNPAGLILGHGWPSPNAWVIPFFLWALLFASWERWFIAGVTIGIGAMFQGQHLLIVPFWIMWPIFAGQPMRAVRWVIGFFFAFLAVVSGWLLTDRPDITLPDRELNTVAVVWIVFGIVAVLAVPIVRRWARRQLDRMALIEQEGHESTDAAVGDVDESAAVSVETAELSDTRRGAVNPITLIVGASLLIILLLLIWPVLIYGGVFSPLAAGVALLAIGLMTLLWWKGWQAARYAVPAVIAAQLLLCIPLFGASTSWWEVGFMYGTERHYNMAVGQAANLGSLLRDRYGWRTPDEVVTTLEAGSFMGLVDADRDVTIRELMLAIYIVTLILASLATAIQWRRGNRNFLLAATVPWLLMALIPAQMHERYLGFAALAGVVWIGAAGGIGWALLGMFLAIVTYGQVLGQMVAGQRPLTSNPNHPFYMETYFGWFTNRELLQVFRRAHPDIAWALLLAAAVVLIASFMKAAPTTRLPKPLTGHELEAPT